MAEVVQLAKPEAAAAVPRGGFVMTESARNVLRTAQMVAGIDGGALGLIAAAPGTGKSSALWQFKASSPRAILIEAIAREDDSPWGVASTLMETLGLGMPNSRNMRGARLAIAEAIGVDGILLVDEAQNLVHRNPRSRDDWSTFEWLRGLSEEGCLSVLFVENGADAGPDGIACGLPASSGVKARETPRQRQ